jgi:CSLREA domain-containing protein
MRFDRILAGVCVMLFLSSSVFSAVYTVTKTADTNDGVCDTDCSLREAIAAANASADNDTILFGALFSLAPQTITLSGTDLIINNNGTLSILGPANRTLTVSGNNQSRIFTNNTGAITTIGSLRVTAGNGASSVQTGRGGGIYNNGGNLSLASVIIEGNSAANGGGTNNAGTGSTMTISGSLIANNTATGAGGAMQNFSTSTLNLINTTVNGNTCNSTLTGGGGIQANGTLTMSNVTFSNNSATGGDGGAIYYNGSGLAMNNVTVANNTATGGGSGGLHKSTTTLNANVRNSIFADNTGSASPDVTGAISSQGNNIIKTVGASTGWVASDLQNTDPLLSPPGFYGSPAGIVRFYTRALTNLSPAINAGNNCVTDLTCAAANPPVALTTDQRGASRVGNVDIGAYEVNSGYVAVLPRAFLRQPYNFTLVTNNAGFAYGFSPIAPPGLDFFEGGGIIFIAGSPTQLGTFTFTLTGNATGGGQNAFSVNYSVTVFNVLPSVSGRVTTSGGAAVPNALVVLTDAMNNTRYTRTNGFGYFVFDEVATNQTYTVSVVSKQYQFAPQMITVTDNVTNLNFTAQ